ncbi:MAG: Gldg family protein [Sandaracinaceae bacterium]
MSTFGQSAARAAALAASVAASLWVLSRAATVLAQSDLQVTGDAGGGSVTGFVLQAIPAVIGLLMVGLFVAAISLRERLPAWLSPSALAGLLLPLSLLLLFVAERILGEGHPQLLIWRVVASLAVLGALGWRLQRLQGAEGAARQAEIRLLAATLGVLFSLVLYAFGTDWGLDLFGLEGESRVRVGGVLGALWPAVLVVSGTALFMMELAYGAMPIPAAVEIRRIDVAAAAGLTLALSFVFVVSINYVAQEEDVRKDLSYFRTTRPSETTLRMVRTLEDPVTVVLFYPRVHEVLDRIRPYFAELEEASDKLTVRVLDHALAPELTQRHQITRNGYVLITRGEGDAQQGEKFDVGIDLAGARSRLRTLDGRFQEPFAQLTTRPRELHFTAGHRERSFRSTEGDPPEQRLSTLDEILERVNIEHESLGIAQGLASGVPEDARAVAIVGPRDRFLPEEIDSLRSYVADGGRLLVMVDPDEEHELGPLLGALGLRLREGVLHSDRQFFARTRTPADRELVYAEDFTAHPVVTQANRRRGQAVGIFVRGGALERHDGPNLLDGVTVAFPLRTPEDSFWLDQDGNHEKDEGEPTGRFQLIAAVNIRNPGGEEGRAVVIADGNYITDAVIRNPGNFFVFADAVQWLVGEEEIIGPTATEEDVPIQHTRDEDQLWFYGTSFGAPLPLLLIGLVVARRRRRSGPKRRGDGPAGPPPGGGLPGERSADGPERSAADEPEGADPEPERAAADEPERSADEPEGADAEPERAADEPERSAADEPQGADAEPERSAADALEGADAEPERAAADGPRSAAGNAGEGAAADAGDETGDDEERKD